MYVKNKVAFVTGGASGLGFVYATKLLENGAKAVTLADVDAAKGEGAAKELTQKFGANKALFIKLDVVNKKEFEDAIKKTIESFGNFDILINNAGIMNDTVWEKEIDINMKGLVNGSLLAFEEYLPKYKTVSSEPVIVNIASTAGINICSALPVYSGTKYGVIGFSKSLAAEENYRVQNVRILTLCPGATSTPLVQGLAGKVFAERYARPLEEYFKTQTNILQPPDVVGDAMIKILENGEHGSIWVIEMSKLYQIDVPNQKDLKTLRYL